MRAVCAQESRIARQSQKNRSPVPHHDMKGPHEIVQGTRKTSPFASRPQREKAPSAASSSHDVRGSPARCRRAAAEVRENANEKKAGAKRFKISPARGTLPKV